VVQPTRRQQPYRKGAATRTNGMAYQAMKRGTAAYSQHPMHAQRQLAKRYHARRKSKGVASLAIRKRY
jgi:hypothetical protein